MANDNGPFHSGQKVVCLKTSPCRDGLQFLKDSVYTVRTCRKCSCGKWIIQVEELCFSKRFFIILCHMRDTDNYAGGQAKHFAPLNPYSNSVSKELADKAMNVGDGADQPIKIKELETSN